ncbi:hypothetical protein VB716_06690 [Synechococcus sp. CCY9201]|uniref:hypothetical protein n=1 Tax=Synechococcus sp. CCY9201 TaxID=174697 RepID=UPI002B220845|nr:hypothetical protein [Synechococcus sp. CCY9201]MEA5473907.1 hypothetical protein [Synechococcus sp. CCY9201]
MAATVMALPPAVADAAPYGTWLSQPQIWFHSTKGSLSQVMAQIRSEHYQVVILDYRKVSDSMQQEVAREALQAHGIQVEHHCCQL